MSTRRSWIKSSSIAAVIAACGWANAASDGAAIGLDVPSVVLGGLAIEIPISREAPEGVTLEVAELSFTPVVDAAGARFVDVAVPSGDAVFALKTAGGETLAEVERTVLPGWFSILPPVVAFALALMLRQVIPALFISVWFGGFLIIGPSLMSAWQGMLDAVARYALEAVVDPGHAALIVFTFMMGGLVAIVSRNGGTRGIVDAITVWANSPQRGQLASYVMGLLFFFDDYANTLVVGKTMRPISDAMRISREKLAFIVDATAAPVATLALVSSWIGFQLGLIDDAIGKVDGLDAQAYGVFLNSLPYNFYPIFMLIFVLLVCLTGRDFGPMRKAERRAMELGQVAGPGASVGDDASDESLDAKAGVPHRAFNAYVPLAALVVTMLAGLYVTGVREVGAAADLREIIGAADSYLALMWATLIGVMVAGCLSLGQRILSLGETVDAWYAGSKSMLLAVIVLVLAWSLSNVNTELHTAEYLTAQLGDVLDARWLPAIVFVLAAVTAFATGTSWGVMGILMPLVIPLTWTSMELQGVTGSEHLLYASVSAVLAGAVMGDHASPISDTTILSSIATSCDHIEHVRTQLPYALLVGGIATVAGSIPAGFGVPWWVCLIVGAALTAGALRWLGEPASQPS